MAKNDLTRPCEVDGEACKFHGFTRNDKVVVNCTVSLPADDCRKIARISEKYGLYPPELISQVVVTTAALIEWPSGRVSLESVEKIRFTDQEEVLE